MNIPAQQVQFQGPRPMPRWPLYSPISTRSTVVPITQDNRLVNGYVEFDPKDKLYWVYKRFGLNPAALLTNTATALGMFTCAINTEAFGLIFNANKIFFVLRVSATVGNLYVWNGPGSGAPTGPYAISFGGTTSPLAFFNIIPGASPVIAIGTDVAGYGYTLGTSTFGAITDSNFPTHIVPGWVTLDDWVFVMDPLGNIWGSLNQSDLFAWSALNVIKASSNADGGVALAKQLSYVIAFKQWSTQVFYDAGNAATPTASPLAPVSDAQVPYGCFHAGSIASIDDTLLWMTSNQTISPQIIQMDNLTPQIVSTPNVDRILNQAALMNNFPSNGITSMVIKNAGHRMYLLTIVSLNLTLVYDIDQQAWYIWTDYQGNYYPINAIQYWPAVSGQGPGLHIGMHSLTGTLYQIGEAVYFPTDYGNVFPVDIYTPNYDRETMRRKTLNNMYFQADKYAGSILQARFTDDDYNSWSNFRTVDLSLAKPRLNKCGTFRHRRAYHFRHQCPTPFRLRIADLDLTLGSK